jgi:hypothetical protein
MSNRIRRKFDPNALISLAKRNFRFALFVYKASFESRPKIAGGDTGCGARLGCIGTAIAKVRLETNKSQYYEQ